jgi:hypothetical protein
MANGRKTDMERITMEERREQVFNLRRNGASFREIARHLNTTEATAHRDYTAVMKRVIDQNTGSADSYRQLELTRLDALILRLHPMVFPPSPAPGKPAPNPSLLAADRFLRVLDMRAKLLGLYAPEKFDGTVTHITVDTLAKLLEEQGHNPATVFNDMIAELMKQHVVRR